MQATDSADAHVSEALLAHVRTLSCSSFLDSSPSAAASSEVVAKPLAAWRVEHATSMLQQSPELESLRYALVPKCALAKCTASSCFHSILGPLRAAVWPVASA